MSFSSSDFCVFGDANFGFWVGEVCRMSVGTDSRTNELPFAEQTSEMPESISW